MARIVNFGSLCIDFVYAVPAIAGPAQTVASTACEQFAGGKGLNQSIAASLAGAKVVHVGAVGGDGQFLIDTLHRAQVDTQYIINVPQPSGHAIIQVDPSGRNSIVISGGANRAIPNSQVELLDDLLQTDDWLLLQNETNDLAKAIKLGARRSDVHVALNFAPPDASASALPIELLDLLIVNAHEATVLSGCEMPAQALETLAKRCPETTIVLTLGASGLLYAEPKSSHRHSIPAVPVNAVDETAAGDAFVGYLLAALVDETNPFAGLEQALMTASAAGALAVTRAGAATSMPRRADVERFIEDTG